MTNRLTNRLMVNVLTVGVLSLAAGRAQAGWPGDPAKCMPDAVKAGSVCMDKYEASVWSVPNPTTTNKKLVAKIQNGVVKVTDLNAGGATQVSPSSSCTPAFPGTFPANGQWTAPLYAVSIAGVHPTGCATWFQAKQACANARKRLPSNAEWQLAVAGTPDPGTDNGSTDCNVSALGNVVNTGSRMNCKSNWGAFDMVGNLNEWVADWMPASTACGSWSGSSDFQCLAGAATSGAPGALLRGGGMFDGAGAGPLAIWGGYEAVYSNFQFGFRCAR